MAENLDNVETNLDLQKTIKIEDDFYNVNAVYSDKAGRVTTPLEIKKSLITGEQSGSFNGDDTESTIKVINYVPSTGGKFTGPVHIEAAYPPENASIINYGQIETLVNLLTGSSAFAWTPNSKAIPQLDTIKNNAGQIENLRVVVGTTDHFATFRKLLGTGSPGLVIDNTGTVTSISVAIAQTIVIPCKYNSKPVTSIGSKAFYDKNFGSNSIRFSSNITNIANDAIGPAPNSTGPNIRYIIYDGTQEDWDTLMKSLDTEGDTYKIFKNRADTGNVIITSNIKDYIDGPFIYICNDYEGYDYVDSDPRIRQMYLKLPNNPDFIEISTNAIRLTSWDKTADNKYYYTYETLAAIIAGINSRLAALGSTALTLPEEFATGHVVVPDSEALPENIINSNKVLVAETVVPTVQELAEAITKSYGNTDWVSNSTTNSINNVITHLNSTNGDSIKALREDLDALTKEVTYEISGENIVGGINSRLDYIEKIVDTREHTITLGSTTLNETQLKKILNFIDSIELS